MLAVIIEALRSIIDLRAKGRQDRKVGLEIQKLEQEKVQRESPLTHATIDDVHRYDPKVRIIQERSYMPASAAPPIPTDQRASPVMWFRVLCGLLVLGVVLYSLVRLILYIFR